MTKHTIITTLGFLLFSSSGCYAQKVFIVQYSNQADVKIYFVAYKNQAGWVNNAKKHYLY